jgi:N-acetylmuramoyl-L-alanine amidase
MRAGWGLSVLALTTLAHAQELREVRIWESPEGTRVVLDLDAGAAHEIQTLSNPDRLVLDLRGVKRATDMGSTLDGKGLVQRVRTGEHDDALRIVLDLTQPADAKAFGLEPNGEYGYRLIVDLAGDQIAALAQTLAPSQTPAAQPVAAAPVPSASAPKSAPAQAGTPRRTVIAIDAGHGGEDPGARGRHGLEEKDVALAIARKLARLVDAEPGYKAVLIRDGDYFIPLRGRINKARDAQADLFVSIHCNASPNREAEGSAVYVLSPRGATNEHARWLAGKENAADLIGGIELQDKDDTLAAVLFDISQTSAMEASIDVGSRVLGSLGNVNNLLRADVQQAGFVVLKSPDIPSILVETAFISNAKEERQLKTPEYQQQMAASVLAGIKGYFETYRPQTTQLVASKDDDDGGLVEVGYRAPAAARRSR